jgi:all-trans-retinol dehydrogenase (NAD+)
MSDFKGKKVLVTGAAMGLGRLISLRVLELGAELVVMWDYNAEAMDKTASELRERGYRVETQVVDVSSLDSIREAAALTLAQIGAVDILFNNAGVVKGGSFLEHSHQDLERTIRINTLGVMHVTRAFIDKMVEQGSGHVVNIASAAGLMPVPLQSAYSPSKWGCLAFSESLRIEMEDLKTGVRVTTICPSYIDTGMFKGVTAPLLTPILQPDDAVSRIIRGVQKNQLVVCMPWIVNLLPAFWGLLPRRAFDAIVGRFFGVYKSMNQFIGHGK